MNNHIPSFDEFINESSANESMTFDQLKDTYLKNPYGIGADGVEFVDGDSPKLIFRHSDKSRRDQIEKKLKELGFPAKKMSKSVQDKAYKYRYELYLYESEEINESSISDLEKC